MIKTGFMSVMLYCKNSIYQKRGYQFLGQLKEIEVSNTFNCCICEYGNCNRMKGALNIGYGKGWMG